MPICSPASETEDEAAGEEDVFSEASVGRKIPLWAELLGLGVVTRVATHCPRSSDVRMCCTSRLEYAESLPGVGEDVAPRGDVVFSVMIVGHHPVGYGLQGINTIGRAE